MEIWGLIAQGANEILSLETLWWMIIGVAIGTIAGILPGFAAGNVCALLMPLSLGLSTTNALVFMGAIYSGSGIGGAIPGILFNVPTSAQGAVTALDGYQMCRQGKADIALGIALAGSAIGTVVSTIISIFAVKPMAQFSLSFGPAEMFCLALAGVAIISSVMGDDPKKGLLSAAFGFLVAAMPADPYHAMPRATFGFLELYDSIPLVPALVGVFAFPSLLALSKEEYIIDISTGNVDFSEVGKFRRLFQGAIETIKRPIQVGIASVIGTVIGIVPGTGASIATFVSYGRAVSMAKDPSEFGKGSIDGVIAAETADNGVAAGAMIPAFALGIPGSATTAIMLSVVILHGIVPGPNVITHHAPMVYGFFLSLLVSGLLLFPVGVVFCKMFSKLTVIKSSVIVPVLLAVCLVGAYASRQFMFDMYLMMVFGVIGILMSNNKFPPIPFLFGIVLGPIAERSFIQSISISRFTYGIFFDSVICKVLWVIIVFMIALPWTTKLYRKIRPPKKAGVQIVKERIAEEAEEGSEEE